MILSRHIDWSTLDILSGDLTTGDNAIGLTEGRWLVFAFVTFVTDGDVSLAKGLIFKKNGVVIRDSYGGATPNTIWASLTILDLVNVSAGDTFVITAERAATADRTKYVAIKL